MVQLKLPSIERSHLLFRVKITLDIAPKGNYQYPKAYFLFAKIDMKSTLIERNNPNANNQSLHQLQR